MIATSTPPQLQQQEHHLSSLRTPTMFHDGSLQSGISRAIQEKKVVACFVRGAHPNLFRIPSHTSSALTTFDA